MKKVQGMKFLCTAAVLFAACGSDSMGQTGGAGGGCGGSGGVAGSGGSAGCGGSGGMAGSGGTGGSAGTGGTGGSAGTGGTGGSAGTGGTGGGTLGVITQQVQVGAGYTDVSPHQLVRTSGNVLYVSGPTCGNFPLCPGNTLKMFRATGPGRPAAFQALDETHEPPGVGSNALAIDGSDRIHVLWNQRDSGGTVRYAIFNTTTDTWGTPETVEVAGWTTFGQGDEGVALALDATGAPHAAWNVQAADGSLQIHYAIRGPSGWGTITQIDDVRVHSSRHPTMAFGINGDLRVMWIDGSTEYNPDGIIRSRTRSACGQWSASVSIPDSAMTAIDNGPSLLVTPDGVYHTTFCNNVNDIRYWYDAGNGWQGGEQPAAVVTHDPSLGPDGAGGVYIYGHGPPQQGLSGHGDDLYYMHKGFGETSFGAWTRFELGRWDSSVSVRWSQYFHAFPDTLDIVYWNDNYPNIMFIGTN